MPVWDCRTAWSDRHCGDYAVCVLSLAVLGDFCQWQTFNATCNTGQVVLIEHALYGRMRFGRCLDRDYGYLGCSVSVLPYVEHRCSGRRTCQISLPDAYLDNVPKPCPSDLKAYLELSYHCLDGKQNSLSTPDYLHLHAVSISRAAHSCCNESFGKLMGDPQLRLTVEPTLVGDRDAENW